MNLDLMKRGADAEEMTHCMECVHSYKRTDARGSFIMCSAGSGFEVEPDFYCAWGETSKKEQEGEGQCST